MRPDHTKTRVISSSHSIEVGCASWDDDEISIRSRYDGATGRFSPHASSELPLGDLQPLMEVAAQHDLLPPSHCVAIIQALAASIRRRLECPIPTTTVEEVSDVDPTPESIWPREITIRATIETARRSLGDDYDEDHEGDDALLNEIGQSMETLEIHSWNELEIPDGYEIADDEDRDDYRAWQKRR